ncbi:MAG: hypothetical protein JNJ51_07900 [Methylobacillus glycogenes]|nr:hypothetical protein [Methylobacillus glycogenes]
MSAIADSLVLEQGYTLEQVKLGLKDWDIQPIHVGGRQVGEIMLRNNELHVAIVKGERLRLGKCRLISDTLTKLLAEKGFLVTRLFKGDKHRRLIEGLGFVHTHSDEDTDYFWMNEYKGGKHDRN